MSRRKHRQSKLLSPQHSRYQCAHAYTHACMHARAYDACVHGHMMHVCTHACLMRKRPSCPKRRCTHAIGPPKPENKPGAAPTEITKPVPSFLQSEPRRCCTCMPIHMSSHKVYTQVCAHDCALADPGASVARHAGAAATHHLTPPPLDPTTDSLGLHLTRPPLNTHD